MRRSQKTQSFADIAGKVLKKADTSGKREASRAVSLWRELMGDDIARHTRGFAMRGSGEMVVFVDSGAWATQLSLMSGQLMETLNAHLGKDPVKSLRFTVSRKVKEGLPFEEMPAGGDVIEKDSEPEPVPLNEVELSQVTHVASAIKDAELREVVIRVMTRDLELKKGARQGGSM